MSPVVEAAVISGGWATVVAIISYLFNRATTRATIAATSANAMNALDAAHEAQIWDKKAEAHVEAIGLLSRNLIVRLQFTPDVFDSATAQRLRETYGEASGADWARVQAEAMAYAPQQIVAAIEASAAAQGEFVARFGEWQAGGRHTGDRLYEVARAAMEKANAADEALRDLFRADLAQRPSERARQPGAPGPGGHPAIATTPAPQIPGQ